LGDVLVCGAIPLIKKKRSVVRIKKREDIEWKKGRENGGEKGKGKGKWKENIHSVSICINRLGRAPDC
jgi:hypothetical protein